MVQIYSYTNRKGEQFDVLVDDDDYERMLDHGKWRVGGNGYVIKGYTFSDGTRTTILLHRFILLGILRYKNEGIGEIDHINGDKLDNRRENLRFCTRQENTRNCKKRNGCSSHFKGVSYHKNRISKPWRAHIRIHGKHKHLGSFATELEAHDAWKKVAQEHYGEFFNEG